MTRKRCTCDVGDLRSRIETRGPDRGAAEQAVADGAVGVTHHSQLDPPHTVDDRQGRRDPGAGSTAPHVARSTVTSTGAASSSSASTSWSEASYSGAQGSTRSAIFGRRMLMLTRSSFDRSSVRERLSRSVTEEVTGHAFNSRHLVLAHHGRRVLHFRVSGGAVTGMVTPAVGLEPMDPFDESVMRDFRSSRHSSAAWRDGCGPGWSCVPALGDTDGSRR